VTHLGDRLTAFVDGELDHIARDKALVHLTRCEQCRAVAEAERRTKLRLSAGQVPDEPPALAARLLAIAAAEPSVGPPGPSGAAMPGGRPGSDRPAGRARDDRRPPNMPGSPAARRRAPRVIALTGGFFSVGGLAFGAAFMLGGSGDPGAPPLQPPVTTFTVQHVVTSNDMPLTDPAAGVVPASLMSGSPTGPAYGGFGTVPISRPTAGVVPAASTGAAPR
jgi:hypothetical protein